MKKILVLSALCSGAILAGCNHATKASSSNSATADPSAAMVVAPSGATTIDANTTAGTVASTAPSVSADAADTTHRDHATAADATSATTNQSTSSATVATSSASSSDAKGAASTTYPDKETYAHAGTDASSTALIGGGPSQSGGAPIAPSASVVEGRVSEWHLSAADIQADVDHGTAIVRTKEIGANEPTGKMDDDALLTLVNNRLLADPDTVRVATKMEAHNGEITIRGSAASAELIGRTVAIVLDTKGVTKVTSELKIEANQVGAPHDDAAHLPATDKTDTDKPDADK